jgi:hypothetical protein
MCRYPLIYVAVVFLKEVVEDEVIEHQLGQVFAFPLAVLFHHPHNTRVPLLPIKQVLLIEFSLNSLTSLK